MLFRSARCVGLAPVSQACFPGLPRGASCWHFPPLKPSHAVSACSVGLPTWEGIRGVLGELCVQASGPRFRLSGAASKAGGQPALVSCPCCRGPLLPQGRILLQLLPAAGGQGPSGGSAGLSPPTRPASQGFVLHLLSLRRHPVSSLPRVLPARVRISRQLATEFLSVEDRKSVV